MFKKSLTFILTILVFNLFLTGVAFAGSKEEKAAELATKVKANIAKLGVGKDSKVQIKLRDGTKIKGCITEIGSEGFEVMNEKTGAESYVPYTQAKQVKGNNLSKGVKIAIGVGLLVAYFFLWASTDVV